jgi:hypothetical protein
MLVRDPKPELNRPESLAMRKARQAIEGSEAVKEYRAAQQAATERMLALRRERLAQLAKQTV